jgi:hypothetical protein
MNLQVKRGIVACSLKAKEVPIMKKLFITSLVLGLLAFLALPGLAQVSLTYAPAMSPYLKELPQELERLDPKTLALLDPKALGQLDPQALAKVAKELNQIDPQELGQIDPQIMTKLDPQALAQLNQQALAQLDPKALALLDPKALARLSPQALSKVTEALKQVDPQALDPVPGQLDPKALIQLNPQALWQLDPKALALLDPKALAQLDPQALSKVAQALEQVDPQALGQLDPQALAKLDPQALAQFDPQALGKLDPKALALLDPKALAQLDAQALGQIGRELAKLDPQALEPVTKVQPSVTTQDTGPAGQEPDVSDVSFDVDVEKEKTITIDKRVDKTIDFTFDYNAEPAEELPGTPALAEVEVFKCDTNEKNELTFYGLNTNDVIQSSFNQFVGIAQLNQASGLLNNQGNVFAASLTGSPPPGSIVYGLSLVEVAVEKANVRNELSVTDLDSLNSNDAVESSFLEFRGLSQINQASGVLNNQDNVMAVAANLDGTIGFMAENDTFLSMQNANNEVNVTSFSTNAIINNSFNVYQGVAQVNQGSGALNNQTNIISIAYAGHQVQP